MKRMLVLVLVLVGSALALSAFSVAQAVPAKRPYEPPPIEADRIDFRGTTWQGKTYEGWAMTIVFEPNGVVTFSYNGSSSKNASWRAEGNTMYMELNNKYCEFRGTMVGDSLKGDSWNVTGLRWKTHLTRVAGPR